jgi:hypothetical protein
VCKHKWTTLKEKILGVEKRPERGKYFLTH